MKLFLQQHSLKKPQDLWERKVIMFKIFFRNKQSLSTDWKKSDNFYSCLHHGYFALILHGNSSRMKVAPSPQRMSKLICFPANPFSKSLESLFYSACSDILFIVVHPFFKWIKSILSGIKNFVNIYTKVLLIRTAFSQKEGYLTVSLWLCSWTLF